TRGPALPHGCRVRGADPLLRDRARERRDGLPGRRGIPHARRLGGGGRVTGTRRRRRGGGARGRAGRRFRPRAARRPRHRSRRAGPLPVRRPEAAHRAGPCGGGPPPLPRARRSALRGRRRHRGPRPGAAAHRAGLHHGAHRRSSAVDGRAGGPRRRHGRRPGRRGGRARGAAGDLGGVSRPHGGGGMSGPGEPDTLPPDIAKRARRLLLDLARPELPGYAVLVVILLLFGIGNAVGPAFIARAMDHGIPAAIEGDTAALAIPLAVFLLVTLATGVADFFGTRLTGTLAQRLMVSLRRRMFDHVQRLGIAYHERSTSGRLVSRQT